MRTASRNNTFVGGGVATMKSNYTSSAATTNTSPRGYTVVKNAERVVRSPPRQKGNKQLAQK